jgi:hypothetical protein
MGLKRLLTRRTFTTLLELIGACLVVIGVSSVSVAAGLVVAGIALVGIGYLLE